MAEVWAKDNEIKLHEHIDEILKCFERIKDKIINQDLHEKIKLAIALHDIGKVLPSFQIKSLGNKNYEPYDLIAEIPHSLFSVLLIDEKKLRNYTCNDEYANYILTAVAYHHWRDNFQDFIKEKSEKLIRSLKRIDNFLESIRENLKNEIEKISDDELKTKVLEIVNIDFEKIEEVKRGFPLDRIAVPPYLFDYEPIREEPKKEYILISGFLQRCDHFASWCEKEEKRREESLDKIEIEPKNFEDVKNSVIDKVGKSENEIWQIEKARKLKDKNLILVAPTGYGKTEFAFLWGSGEKFVYTLPLRSAVNQIFERAEKIFSNDKVGLLHSDADVYLLEKHGDVEDSINLYECAKNLSFPVIISTGDQFSPYALRPPGYEKIFALFSYARLIIDEVQAYNPQACAIVVKFIEWVCKMGGKFLLMTATLPEFVKKELKEDGLAFDEINIYEHERAYFQKFYKHKVKITVVGESQEKNYDDVAEEVLEKAISGKRVLVIFNTVKKAQEFYEKLKNKIEEKKEGYKNIDESKIFLLHSRFTIKDREDKEKKISEEFLNPKPNGETEGKILISTQVVEASLDIDADILFTEICPLDALVQRMGRVARRYFYENRKVIDKSGAIPEHDLNDGDFKAWEKYNNNEPNVYILVDDEEIESGGGRVYETELIKLSLAWLWKFKESKEISFLEDYLAEDKDWNEIEGEIEKFFEEHFREFISKNGEKGLESNKKKGRKKKGKKEDEDKVSIYEEIIGQNRKDWMNKFGEKIKDLEFELSEYDKYRIVSLFYRCLKPEGGYLKGFYQTLDLLDAGYMSEKKAEAQRIFREINDVQAVPEEMLDNFIEELKNFDLKNERYLDFKIKILGKFTVPVQARETTDERLYNKVLEKLEDITKRKLEKYLSRIYVTDGRYDREIGFIRGEKDKSEEIEKRII